MRCKNCGVEIDADNESGLCPECIKEAEETKEAEEIKEAEESKEAVRDATLKLGGLFTGPKFFNTLSIVNLVFCVFFGMFDFFLTCFNFARSFVELEGDEFADVMGIIGKFQYTYDGKASTFIVVAMTCVVIAVMFLITKKGNRIVNLATISLAAVYLCIIALTFFIGLVAEVVPSLFGHLNLGDIFGY